MKLIWRIITRVAVLMLIVFPLWGFFFYKMMINEVNDETDDNLDLFAEEIIKNFLVDKNNTKEFSWNGTNNSYIIEELNNSDIDHFREYSNQDIFIPQKKEDEPARVLKLSFSDNEGKKYLITVMTPTVESKDLIEAILHSVIILFVSLLSVILIIVGLVLFRNMRPLDKLIHWIDNYKLGENVADLNNPTEISEFRKLNEAAIMFAKRNEDVFLQQKQFIGNASHEIQTPIAVCLNRLELLANSDLNENQLNEVIKTKKSLDYLSKLNKSLLFITKIDNGQFVNNSKVFINEIIEKCIEDYSEIYSFKNINITLRGMDKEYFIKADSTLIVSLISNLVRNAFIHNIENGEIIIELNNNSLIVKNSGKKEALDKNKIFEPFLHSSDNKNSTGLGLAIVKSICRYYKYDIEYSFVEEKHIFSLNFSH
ncbi:MAG: HAMP domain-containing sensor histidine kinase [Bacteroidales bacterium]|nr:HAMP domain-containing sensor histidine kinase [Bacteroidales bacterium]